MPINKDALMVGDFKLLRGTQPMALWQGPLSPNATVGRWVLEQSVIDCGETGCLYNVLKDPGEHHNLADAQPGRARDMNFRLDKLSERFFVNKDENTYACPPGVDPPLCACWMAVNYYGGFMGPFQV